MNEDEFMQFTKKAQTKSLFSRIEERAQAAAPFELFVAVIIMTFVIIMGYSLLTRVQGEICMNSVDKAMTEFKRGLEETVNSKTSKKISFQPDSACFDSKERILDIRVEPNSKVCAARCDFASDNDCYLMTFSNPTFTYATNFKVKCLNLPPLVSFLPPESDYCEDTLATAEGYELVNLDEEQIQRGNYLLVNATRTGDTYPRICVWYRP